MLNRILRPSSAVVCACALVVTGCGGGGGGGGGGTTNTPPSFSSATEFTFPETQAVDFVLTVTDPDSTTVTITGVNGGDSAQFVLDPASGRVTANTPQGTFDFEAPLDSDGNNVYVQELELSDGVNTVRDTITVTITDVDEPPEFAVVPETLLDENATGEIVVFTATDPEGQPVSDYQIFEVSKVGEVVNAQRLLDAFSIDPTTGALSVVVPFDAELEGTQDPITVTVSASDGVQTGQGGVVIRLVDLPAVLATGIRISGRDLVNRLGADTSAVGDVDNDGVAELFVSEDNGEQGQETGYLLWGDGLAASLVAGPVDDTVDAIAETDRLRVLGEMPANTTRRSTLVAVDVGDVDNDGFGDVLIVLREARNPIDVEEVDNGPLAVLLWGDRLAVRTTDVDLFALDPLDGVVIGGLPRIFSVRANAAAADFDDDGRSDLVLGLPERNTSYIVFGDALEAAGASLDLLAAGTDAVVEMQILDEDRAILQQSAEQLAAMEDLTGDGVPELVVSATGLEPNLESGALVVDGSLFAAAKGVAPLVNLAAAANDASIVELLTADIDVNSLAADGDADNDGLPDLAIGHVGENLNQRVASVVFGAAISAAFGTTDEVPLTFTTAGTGVAITDVDYLPTFGDQIIARWAGNATAGAGSELLLGIGEITPLGRERAGVILAFDDAVLTGPNAPDLQVDSGSPDAALLRVLQGYASGATLGALLYSVDLDGDGVREFGTAGFGAGSDEAGALAGGLLVLPGTLLQTAFGGGEGAVDLAQTVVVEAP